MAKKLSHRQQECVELLCQGLSNQQIAARLGLRTQTVKNHLLEAYQRMQVHDRTQVVLRRMGAAAG